MTALYALLAVASLGHTALGLFQPDQAKSAIKADDSPIRKVITLIQEMQAQVNKDAAADEAAHEKYMCWCKTNEEAKTQAIADAESRIDELTSLLEELAARESSLKTQIAALKQDIADDQDALASATSVRNEENSAFLAEEADLKETVGLLKEAVDVLSKVQFLQKQGVASDADGARAKAALVQLENKVAKRGHSDFLSVMKRDLFDVLGSLADAGPTGFLPKKSVAFVEHRGSLLPWEKTEEQVGMESKSTDLTGAAANAKSYNSRSGRIFGLLEEMHEETARDLAEAQKAEATAENNFQKLKAAKLDEIAVGTKQKKRKEKTLSDTLFQASEAKEDREATQDALSADDTFLANMLKDCKSEDDGYTKRTEIRSQEAVAISETLRILTADDARDLYAKTDSFVQLSGTRNRESLAERTHMQDKLSERAMEKIAVVARRHKNWALVSLAVRMRLDAFTKVKEALDKMLAELSKQQKEEYQKWEMCKANIDTTEDDIKVGEQTKEDLARTHQNLVNTIDTLTRDIAALKQEEEDMEVALKAAGEQRKQQNQVYQTSVMDQRATTNILNKALARLKQFYQTKSLLQVEGQQPENQPGRAVAPPPPKGNDYAKSGGAGGVVQLLMKIIQDSEVEEQELNMDEQHAQKLYGEFVAASTATIEADRAAIQEKSRRLSETRGAKSDTQEEQRMNDDQLAKLGDLLKAHHLDCDYLLKYFDIRQQARSEEMDSIEDAKAVLSGADFSL